MKYNGKIRKVDKLPEKKANTLWRHAVISYAPFWKTLESSSETTYTLIKNHHLSSATIDKLRKNKPITTTTLNDLCAILKCAVSDILEFIPCDSDRPPMD